MTTSLKSINPLRQIVVFSFIIVLAACAPRAKLIFAPDLATSLPSRSIFVATTREIKGSSFGGGRSPAPVYLNYDITIPPGRASGDIPFPKAEIDPERQFIVKGRSLYPTREAFRSRLSAEMSRNGNEREAIVYIHGFNNTFDEGLLRIAQLTEDFGLTGVPVHYSWPSAANVLGYAYDRDSVLFARDGLDQLITDLRSAGARNVILVAHSVGGQLVMEVLRQRDIEKRGSVARDIDGVVLISPDIDIDLFRAQAKRIEPLPDPFGIFVSKRDRALSLSARLTGQRDRLGNASAEEVADLNVTVIDVTDFSSGAGHFTAGDSPALAALFKNAGNFDAAFRGDSAGRTGLFQGTVLTVQNATQIILSPVTLLTQ